MDVLSLVLALVIIAALIKSIVWFVPQSTEYVLERFGKFYQIKSAGIMAVNPLTTKVAAKIDLREQVFSFDPQPVITKDNVTMQIDTVIYLYVTDSKAFLYGVVDPTNAIENLTATSMRNIIGELELDETLTSRELINTKIRSILDETTGKWGIKITRVEVKNIVPPKDIQEAMEKQMRAEREKREKILTAEGMKTATILEAEGFRESAILKAEADKKSTILKAEGEADAIIKVQTAYATSLELLTKSNPSEEIIKLKGFEALEQVANGQSTKMIIPSDMTNIANFSSLFHATKEFTEEKELETKKKK